MSFFDDLIDNIGDLFGFGGDDNEATAVATTTVTVSPNISVATNIDLAPLRDLGASILASGFLQASVAAREQELQERERQRLSNQRADDADTLRLLVAGGTLLAALSK